jgi:hypothetical protein
MKTKKEKSKPSPREIIENIKENKQTGNKLKKIWEKKEMKGGNIK